MERPLSRPRITVGMPVYNGADLLPKALECLQQQTFGDFEAIISVDGNDSETAAACRPFLDDPRFRMVVHTQRLDWVGNFNWLLQQDLNEFFCYRQHDDTTAPEFFDVLVRKAENRPKAAVVYCDCVYSGGRNDIEIAPSIKGEPIERIFEYVLRLPNLTPTPVRGLIRTAAIRQAGLVRHDEFRAALQLFGWLAHLLRWGDFIRVAAPLYYRLDHARSYTRQHWVGAHQAAWTTMFTGLLDAAMRVCRTHEERLLFQKTILERIVAYPSFQPNRERKSSEKLVGECLGRLRVEGNEHLLDAQELSLVLVDFQIRLDAIDSIERSRWGRGISQVRQRHRFAKAVYPKSSIRRVGYQFQQIPPMVGKLGRFLYAR